MNVYIKGAYLLAAHGPTMYKKKNNVSSPIFDPLFGHI